MTNNEGRPAAREHLYAVIRLDLYDDEQIVIPREPAGWEAELGGQPVPWRITGTCVWPTLEEATAEVRRLNALRPGTGARYFVTLVRSGRGSGG